MARAEIRQLEELKVFDSLKLSVVVTAEILAELTTEVLAEILTAEVLVKLTSGTEFI